MIGLLEFIKGCLYVKYFVAYYWVLKLKLYLFCCSCFFFKTCWRVWRIKSCVVSEAFVICIYAIMSSIIIIIWLQTTLYFKTELVLQQIASREFAYLYVSTKCLRSSISSVIAIVYFGDQAILSPMLSLL